MFKTLPHREEVGVDKISFNDQVVLITGAGRGLGRAYAEELASRGARLVIVDNGSAMDGASPDATLAEAVVEELQGAGATALACSNDLSSEAGARGAVEACINEFGRIDAIIHSASTCPPARSVDAVPLDDFDRALRVNVYAALWMLQAAWPQMKTQNYGRVVLTTSAAIFGGGLTTPYATAKGAVLGLLSTVAEEGREEGILVNAIAPSAATRMSESFGATAYGEWFNRTMRPEQVAVAAAYLASNACSIHGQILAAGGGRVARIQLSESEGVFDSEASVESLAAAMPGVMGDTRWHRPANLSERTKFVVGLLQR